MDKPILDPRDLDESIRTVYVGLNPRSARTIIRDIDAWRDRDIDLCFLNDDDESIVRNAA